jgi:hypothetical protein
MGESTTVVGITSEDVRRSRSTDADARSQQRVLPGPHERAAAPSVFASTFFANPLETGPHGQRPLARALRMFQRSIVCPAWVSAGWGYVLRSSSTPPPSGSAAAG